MKKAPKNKSLSWELLAAASPLAILAAIAPAIGKSLWSPAMAQIAGAGCLATAAVMKAHDYISQDPVRKLKVAFEYCGLYTEKESGISLPKLLKKKKKDNGLQLTYSMPIGLCKSDFDNELERLQQAINGEISIFSKNGLLFLDVAFGDIPQKINWELQELEGELPITIGMSRGGLIMADMADFPHLLVAGQTGGGKSVFLHQMLACLVHNHNCRLFVVDLTKVDFTYMQKHACCGFTIEKAHEILSYLVSELDRRLDVFSKAGVEKVQNYPGDDMPYLVLVVDEFSHLSPMLYKYEGKQRKAIREECHSMLVDLLCRARKVGIHVVLSTQRPDKEVLPGQMKANIPATVCFQVRNRVNSEICLDNDKAAILPGIPGRAIWQFGSTEREVQAMLLTPDEARKRLPGEAMAHPGEKIFISNKLTSSGQW